MKSKSTILILVVLLIVAGLFYMFVIKPKQNEPQATGLVSTTTGRNQVPSGAPANTTGSQVVEILRNLTAIKLDDSVFRNPAFDQLSSMTVTVPDAVNPGRRNPFSTGSASAVVITETVIQQ